MNHCQTIQVTSLPSATAADWTTLKVDRADSAAHWLSASLSILEEDQSSLASPAVIRELPCMESGHGVRQILL